MEQLLKQGGRVVICDLPSSPGQETAKQLKENVAFVPIDVSPEAIINQFVRSFLINLSNMCSHENIANSGNLFLLCNVFSLSCQSKSLDYFNVSTHL